MVKKSADISVECFSITSIISSPHGQGMTNKSMFIVFSSLLAKRFQMQTLRHGRVFLKICDLGYFRGNFFGIYWILFIYFQFIHSFISFSIFMLVFI